MAENILAIIFYAYAYKMVKELMLYLKREKNEIISICVIDTVYFMIIVHIALEVIIYMASLLANIIRD